MIRKILKINGAVVLTKKQRAKIHGGSSECPTEPGYTGELCSTDEECTPILPGAPVFCDRGCCYGAF
ncbi:hypothetical protein [Ascidiimonas aurantiaca]|uniref:hypothetical protein n=1 Tax=Ascidiimonas aurantiaca TaxID=1685432 RepID=UPI0030ECF0D5